MTLTLQTLAAAACIVAANCASAVTFDAGNNPQLDDNVVHNPCDSVIGVGLTVEGCLNANHTQIITSTSDESLTANGGQARIEGTGGAYSRLEIAAVGTNMASVILNVNATQDGFVQFNAGGVLSPVFEVNAAGSNFFTIADGNFSTLSFITTANGIETDLVADVRQVRVGIVPEPETYALMLAGLAAIGVVARRRLR